MKLRGILARLWTRKTQERPATSQVSTQVSIAVLRDMLTAVEQTESQEIGCDEAYAFLDSFADQVAQGEDAAALMPLVQKHLEMCPDCREEFDALLRSLAASKS